MRISMLSLAFSAMVCILSSAAYAQSASQKNMVYVVSIKKEGKNTFAYEEHYMWGGLRTRGKILSEKKKIRTGHWITYFPSGGIDHEGAYIKNKKNGTWKWYFESGEIAAVEVYRKGKRISSTFYEPNGDQISQSQAESSPTPPQGMENFYGMVQQNTQLSPQNTPQIAGGEVRVQFIVEKDGSLSQITCLDKEVDKHLKEEAIRVVSLSPRWVPGKEHNRPARTKMVLPIPFTPIP